MKFHLLTPFSREENKEAILKNFHRPEVIFHPIINKPIEFPHEDWIRPFTFTLLPNLKWPYYYALNKFIDANEFVDDEYYQFINDDDFMEPDFYQKLEGITTDFIVVSIKRGNTMAPNLKYSINTLTARSGCMGSRYMAGEQFILKGKYLRGYQFQQIHIADGKLSSYMWGKYPHKDFTFVKNAYIWFNYLEPGRWNK